MNVTNLARVRYFDRQFLRPQDFADEQTYHLALARLHNLAQHSWGIVSGLDLDLESGQPVVQPGVAIDGYGRLLVAGQKQLLPVAMFDTLGVDRLDAWLKYAKSGTTPVSGYNTCDANGTQPYRSAETPFLLLEKASANPVDGRNPPGVPAAALNSPVPPFSDDPNDVWRVYLGRVTRMPDPSTPNTYTYAVDTSQRPYAGLVGQVIDHPGNATRVEIGNFSIADDTRVIDGVTYTYQHTDPNFPRGFAVFTAQPSDVNGGAATLAPRAEILLDGTLRTRGLVSIDGSVQLSGGAVQFNQPSNYGPQNAPANAAIYRYQDTDASGNIIGDQLRFDLGSGDPAARSFVIGFSTDDGKFTPCVRLELKAADGALSPLLTVYGDLKIGGLLQSPAITSRPLSQEARNAIQASFQSGVSAGNNP